jgi:hypothetical protein
LKARNAHGRPHADGAGARRGVDDGVDERRELHTPLEPAGVGDHIGQHRRRDDPGLHGVLEVVAHVRDAVGPADDLTFGRGRRRP